MDEDSSKEYLDKLKSDIRSECHSVTISSISSVHRTSSHKKNKQKTSRRSHIRDQSRTHIIQGQLQTNGIVTVLSPHDAAAIYMSDCYGKGTVSKGLPAGLVDGSETLQLLPVEALYLVNNNLINVSQNNTKYTTQELWKYWCDKDMLFPHKYAVYTHFRDKGYVVRSGLKYGGDYLLYSGTPDDTHANYLAQCLSVHCSPDWTTVNALRRVNETVAKEIVLCYANFKGTFRTPACIRSAEITTILLKRWIPQKDRELSTPIKNSQTKEQTHDLTSSDKHKSFEEFDTKPTDTENPTSSTKSAEIMECEVSDKQPLLECEESDQPIVHASDHENDHDEFEIMAESDTAEPAVSDMNERFEVISENKVSDIIVETDIVSTKKSVDFQSGDMIMNVDETVVESGIKNDVIIQTTELSETEITGESIESDDDGVVVIGSNDNSSVDENQAVTTVQNTEAGCETNEFGITKGESDLVSPFDAEISEVSNAENISAESVPLELVTKEMVSGEPVIEQDPDFENLAKKYPENVNDEKDTDNKGVIDLDSTPELDISTEQDIVQDMDYQMSPVIGNVDDMEVSLKSDTSTETLDLGTPGDNVRVTDESATDYVTSVVINNNLFEEDCPANNISDLVEASLITDEASCEKRKSQVSSNLTYIIKPATDTPISEVELSYSELVEQSDIPDYTEPTFENKENILSTDKIVAGSETSLLSYTRFMKNDEIAVEVNAIETKDSEIDAKDSEIEAKASEIEAKDSEIDAKDSKIEAKDSEIEAKDSEIEAKDCEIEAKDSEIECEDSQTEDTHYKIKDFDIDIAYQENIPPKEKENQMPIQTHTVSILDISESVGCQNSDLQLEQDNEMKEDDIEKKEDHLSEDQNKITKASDEDEHLIPPEKESQITNITSTSDNSTFNSCQEPPEISEPKVLDISEISEIYHSPPEEQSFSRDGTYLGLVYPIPAATPSRFLKDPFSLKARFAVVGDEDNDSMVVNVGDLGTMSVTTDTGSVKAADISDVGSLNRSENGSIRSDDSIDVGSYLDEMTFVGSCEVVSDDQLSPEVGEKRTSSLLGPTDSQPSKRYKHSTPRSRPTSRPSIRRKKLSSENEVSEGTSDNLQQNRNDKQQQNACLMQ